MKDQTCCFTGHRRIPASEYNALDQRLEAEIEHLIHQGVRYFGAGGAMGFDTMAAFAVLRLRILHPHIRLILVLPCKTQTRGWDRVNKKIYNQIRRKRIRLYMFRSNIHRAACRNATGVWPITARSASAT